MRPLLPKPSSAPAQPIVQMAQPAIDNAAQPPPKNRKRINANTGPAAVKRAKSSAKPTENPRENATQPPAKTRKRTNASTGPAAAKRAKPRAKPPKNPPDDPSTLLAKHPAVIAFAQNFEEVILETPPSPDANAGSATEKRAKPAKKPPDGASERLAHHPAMNALAQRFEEWALETTRPRDLCKLSPENPYRKEIDQVAQILEAGRTRHSGFVHSEYASADESDEMDFNHMASLLSRAVTDVQKHISKTARIRTKFDAVLALLEMGTKVLQADEQVLAGLRSRGFLEVPLNVPQTLRETMACMKRGEALRIGELLEDHAGELYVLAHDVDLKVWSAGMNSVMQVLEGSEDSGYSAEDDMGDEARELVSHF